MTQIRCISGTKDQHEVEATALLTLTIRIYDYAKSIGLQPLSLTTSPHYKSASRYIIIRDRRKNEWTLRISDHMRPRFRGHKVPHFDLISHDGQAGFSLATSFLDLIATGAIEWQPAERERQARKMKRRSGR